MILAYLLVALDPEGTKIGFATVVVQVKVCAVGAPSKRYPRLSSAAPCACCVSATPRSEAEPWNWNTNCSAGAFVVGVGGTSTNHHNKKKNQRVKILLVCARLK